MAAASATAAATAADSPSVAGSSGSNTQQELSPHAPEEPALHSSVGQHAIGAAGAQHVDASSVKVDKQLPAPDLTEQAAEELSGGEQASAKTEGVVGEGRLDSGSEEQAGESVGPQEPALQSGLGQRAASNEGGELLPGPMVSMVLLWVASLNFQLIMLIAALD